ncbi:MAG TPA: 2-C-methyl-D-erythritol 4-phosphate cytidylyltransferase [Cytophagaceae bacterium]|jgi:2-C-methyl-D-erythritol 4-phosphate cytidylyltransferase
MEALFFMNNLNLFAIIVAGGSGSRMKSNLLKQFLPIGGLPILMHTINRFLDYPKTIRIILVLPEQEIVTWGNLCQVYSYENKEVKVVVGGKSRFQSVKNGLNSIKETQGLVAIHDGVRPFLNKATLDNAFKTAFEKGNSIVTVPLKDSIRFVNGDDNKALDRNNYQLVQTPQTFDLASIKSSYNSEELPHFTDDASVAENAGEKITTILGSYENIKITTPEDLALGAAIIKKFQY